MIAKTLSRKVPLLDVNFACRAQSYNILTTSSASFSLVLEGEYLKTKSEAIQSLQFSSTNSTGVLLYSG